MSSYPVALVVAAVLWSLAVKTITMDFVIGGLRDATAVGTKNRVGFSRKRKPGTISTVSGQVFAVWYAIRRA